MAIRKPILLIHWGNPSQEYDEIEEIKLLLEVYLFGGSIAKQRRLAPRMSPCRIRQPDVLTFQARLRTALKWRDNLQILYLSAHGSENQFCYDRNITSSVTYSSISQMLAKYLHPDNCVHVIFGSCGAMSPTHRIERCMPNQVHCVSGFTKEPTAADVSALLASIIEGDVSLFQKLSKCNVRICKDGISPEVATNSLTRRWNSILQRHKENPLRRVLGTGGEQVVTVKRNVRGHWHRRTTACT